jgi:hypothetical protein
MSSAFVFCLWVRSTAAAIRVNYREGGGGEMVIEPPWWWQQRRKRKREPLKKRVDLSLNGWYADRNVSIFGPRGATVDINIEMLNGANCQL